MLPKVLLSERERLKALKSYKILDTASEKEYDDIAKLATQICDVPIALISFIDKNRQWFKAKEGFDEQETPRDISFCTYAIEQKNDVLEIQNALFDDRFKHNSLVTSDETPVIYYLGQKLIDENGFSLGTLCVIDHKPRKLTNAQKEAIAILAKQVVQLLKLRKKNRELKKTKKKLVEKNNLLRDFAGTVSHDIKMPLSNIIMISDILKEKYNKSDDKESLEYYNYLKNSCFHLSDYIDSLLEYYETDTEKGIVNNKAKEKFDIHHLLEDIIDLLQIKNNCHINLPEKNMELFANKSALEQILLNLIGNSLKYNNKETAEVNIDCWEDIKSYYFSVSDNGMGIPKENFKKIFNLFETGGYTDKNNKKGNGIGLSTVKKLVKKMGGKITVSSEVNKFTTFTFSIAK
ncbi:ATP-binding protein [Mesonia sp. K7]|uniref:sensor histidine kinase n=1 Tax=Mesonia sp. K7 TaxID=2218606 RepID=UPI000DA74355|nr:GAF domain-containing sensor histidine kinase [Mesonia sp. K7]PZD78206.1 ATPase [Mesonia sp. K7]